MSDIRGPFGATNVEIAGQVILRIGTHASGLPAPLFQEITLASLATALNVREHDDTLSFMAEVSSAAHRWRKEIIEQYPGELITALLSELAGFMVIAQEVQNGVDGP